MVSFRKYITEAKISQAEIKRRKEQRDKSKKPQDEFTPEVPDEENYEEVSSDEINLNEKHSEKGKLGKSFNNNIIFLNEKKNSPTVKKIKSFFSSNSSFFKNDGSLISFHIQDESVEYKGSTYTITTIFPKDVRSKAASFFDEFKTHEEVDFFIALYTVLRNKGVFEETTLKILKRYLPKDLLEEDALEKIRSVISEEAILYQDNRMMIYKSGGGADKEFSLFSYIVLYHLLSDLRQSVKKKQFKEEVQGIPSSANANVPLFYAARKVGKDDVNEVKVDNGKRDSTDNSGFVKDSEEDSKEDSYEDEYKEMSANVSSEEPNEESDKLGKKYESSLKQKVYSGDKIESLDELSADLADIKRAFEEIKSESIGDKFKKIKSEFSDNIMNNTGENYKELEKEIKTVKLHGGKLGATTMKLSSKNAIRDRAEKAKVDINLKEEILNEISKNIDKLTYKPGRKESSEATIMGSNVSDIIKNQGEIISNTEKSVKERINALTIEYTKRFDSYYNKAKDKIEKLSSFKKTIKKELPQHIIDIGYSINMARSSVSSYTSRVEGIIKDYRNSLMAISNKIKVETEKLEKEKGTYNYKVKEKKFQERLSPRIADIQELQRKENEMKAETQELVSQLEKARGKVQLADVNDDADERKKFTILQNKIKAQIEENNRKIEENKKQQAEAKANEKLRKTEAKAEAKKQKESARSQKKFVKDYNSGEGAWDNSKEGTAPSIADKIKTFGSETREAVKNVLDRAQLKKQFDAVKKEFNQKKTFSAGLKDRMSNFMKRLAGMPSNVETARGIMGINKKNKDTSQATNEPVKKALGEEYIFLTEDELSDKIASKTVELFNPHRVANDKIFNNLRKAVNASDKDALVESMRAIKDILLSGNAPSITIVSYTDKMVDFIGTIINKIDDLDDKMEDVEYKDCISAINALNNFIETGLTNLQNQLEKSFSQQEKTQEIPIGAKPALTTNAENSEEEKEQESDSEEESEEDEPKNLLALAKKKLRSNK